MDPQTTPDYIQFIPFVGLAMQQPGDTTPLITRLIEAAIIGGVVMWGTVQVLGERMDNMQRQMDRMERQITTIREDVYEPR